MCERLRGRRERDSVCVCVCVRERKRERERGEGESVVERMLTGNVWQTKELRVRPAGARLTGSGK